MNGLQISDHKNQFTIDSREAAEWVDKQHSHLLRDIEAYISAMNQNPTLDSAQFFIEGYYESVTGQKYKCYLLTRRGCDMVANKMIGEKGIIFTAHYVTKFEEMEKAQAIPQMTELEILAAVTKALVEADKKADKALLKADTAYQRVGQAFDIFTKDEGKDWRQSTNDTVRQMCQEYGLCYMTEFGAMYKELDEKAGVDIDIRLKRLRERLSKEGHTKTYCNSITKLEVVDRDLT